ncbi:Exopolygalacturonase [Morella rubra]|uniref:Exopolygalacturonase n=1 Tax=Morella rubra TaxID=262757 RepID=A0A6A1VDH9_9ROSI|nr:Exopolygalacturonase [Morella rubra]
MSLRIKAVVDKFVQELKEALDADIQDRIMKEREMQSYIEEREREVAEREAAWKAELSRREAEIARQEARLKMEKENLEKEKSVLMGTASNQDNQDGALEITVSGEKYRCLRPVSFRRICILKLDCSFGKQGVILRVQHLYPGYIPEGLPCFMGPKSQPTLSKDYPTIHCSWRITMPEYPGEAERGTKIELVSGTEGSEAQKSSLFHHRGRRHGSFDVMSFGALADGQTDNTMVRSPPSLSQSKDFGIKPDEVTYMNSQGHLKAATDLSQYGFSAGWIEFGWVEGLTLTGGGTFDGQGAKAWPYNKCRTHSKCELLPTNVKFMGMNKTVVRGITSLNSKFFHIALVECKNFKGSKIKISAPANSPNTDGIHIERSSGVYFSGSQIGTGDDCISIGQGNSQVTISSITCGPGHGISVGSLGRYQNEGDVSGLVVRDCNMTGTSNGIRIKTWANSPGQSTATNMTFENIVMNNVTNPIIIDQAYCPFSSCTPMVIVLKVGRPGVFSTDDFAFSSTPMNHTGFYNAQAPSRVKISDIYFKNIRGTSSTEVAVALECSKGMPCQNIYLEDVRLDLSSGEKHATSICKNVKATYIGSQIPPPCS